jgi:hypothetical protein
MAMAILAASGVGSCGLSVLGDNTSSLSWAHKQSFRSLLCRRAIMAFLALTVAADLRIETIQHVKGEDNVVCDKLSRFEEFKLSPQDLGFSREIVFNISDSPHIAELLAFCNPKLPVQGIDETEMASRAISAIILNLIPPKIPNP